MEVLKNPEYKNIPLAVTGNPKKRTGIILAKNTIAKSMGIKTGEVIWKAKQLCPDLVCVAPDFPTYAQFSSKVKEIYLKFTDKVEPFGIDECWLDVTNSRKLFGSPYEIAVKIKETIKNELGLTISVGISFSKMFAKLGSKLAGNNEINIISKNDYKEKVWHLPVEKLIFVGKSSLTKLKKLNVNTIGDLAKFDSKVLSEKFGVNGNYLIQIANGSEPDEVSNFDNLKTIKSIGNGKTSIVDIDNFEQAKQLIYFLCESVATRLREKGFKALCVHLSIKDNSFNVIGHSFTFETPTSNADDLAKYSIKLFNKAWNFARATTLIRAIRISATSLISDKDNFQTSFLMDAKKQEKVDKKDKTLDTIRNKYGENKIQRALLMSASHISSEISDDFFEE